MGDTYMRFEPFVNKYGIPKMRLKKALKGEFANQVGKKISPEKKNSPYIIDVERTLKLFKEDYI